MISSDSTGSKPLVVIPSSINIDETFAVRAIVRPGETISSSGLTSRPGGKGANVSCALALAGCDAWFVGNVGKEAPWPLQELRDRGVKTDLTSELEDTPTGRAFIQLAEDGENSIVLLKGANYPPTPPSPAEIFSHLPRPATHIVLQNEIPISTTAAYLSYAHAQGLTTVWNPSPLPSQDELRNWKWDEVDILIVNQGEGMDLIAALGGQERVEEEEEGEGNAEKVLHVLTGVTELRRLTWIVMTRGAHGVLASVRLRDSNIDDEDAKTTGKGQEKRTLISLPASKPRQVLDTTGAGDTFAGYLVASIAGLHHPPNKYSSDENNDDDDAEDDHKTKRGQWYKRPESQEQVRHCLRLAGVAAAMAVEVRGAMESIPKGEEVRRRFQEEGRGSKRQSEQ